MCDSTDQKENVKVAEARAQSVAHYLRGKGIRGTRMDISYFPESDPFLPYNPAANYRNRRVVIRIE
jgi:outer membrane protein OmpA-like peptidoglycan-associated protein